MRKLADIVDEGQAKGEIAKPGDAGRGRSIDTREAGVYRPEPIPVPSQRLAECRQIRDAATDLVRLTNCGQCWQRPGRPCTVAGVPGDHLARWQRAERRGLISREDLAAAVADLEVIAAHVIVRGAL